MLIIIGVISDGVANTSRALNIEHVGPLVPGVRIVLDVVLTIVDDEGTVLLEESEQRGAAWAAIEPDNDRVVLRVALRCHKHVMKLLGGTCCQVA